MATEFATRPLLRVATAGSVDDGKSTLIGRLLHDTGSIPPDQLEQIREASIRRGAIDGEVDLALLTDGLRAEREQGITIDVAYRYFQVAGRKVILADTPGHEQYTRNMVTGASTADLGLVLVDARTGLNAQSRRHAAICALLRVPAVWCVNKLDLVGFSQERFDQISTDIAELAAREELEVAGILPVSALRGDNVASRSENTPWYEGPTLLEVLDAAPSVAATVDGPLRLPIQWVIRPQDEEHHDYRAFSGRITSGRLRPGDEVLLSPSGRTSRVRSIDVDGVELDEAQAPQSVAVRLEDDVDAARGEVLSDPGAPPVVTRELQIEVCWMAEQPLEPRSRVLVKHGTTTVKAVVDALVDRLDAEAFERTPSPDRLALNDIGHVHLRLGAPLAVDLYREHRATGSLILIDEATNETVGAGMIVSAS